MCAAPAARRARPPALGVAVSTLEGPGLGQPYGLLVLADGTRLVGTVQNRLQLLTPAGLFAPRDARGAVRHPRGGRRR
jgi:hypothetical protein